MYKFYLVYKITNTINGRTYIGVHKTDDINDAYMGSGRDLKRDIKKIGVEYFAKEILAQFDNPEQMYEMESVLVNEDYVKDPSTYNKVLGGLNTIERVNENLDKHRPKHKRTEWAKQGRRAANQNGAHLKGSQKHKQLFLTDPDYRAAFVQAVRAGRAASNCGFKGQKHTDAAKRKIGEANSKLFKGSGNPNYGKKWMHHPIRKTSRPIPSNEVELMLTRGWVLGRIVK